MKLFYILAGLILSFSPLARAALGDRAASVELDRKNLKATAKVKSSSASSSAYTVQEMDANGTTVREYLSTDGVVFAVTWQGLRRPDLTVLLGSYYTEYKQADSQRAKSVGRQPISLKTTNMVVRHSGHMRDIRGRAYLSSAVPSGVNVEALP